MGAQDKGRRPPGYHRPVYAADHHTVDTVAATADPDTIDAVATTTDASTKTPPGCQSFPMGFEEP